MPVIVYADKLEPGASVKISCPPEVSNYFEATVRSVSRGKKGYQIAVKHGKSASTWHVPGRSVLPLADAEKRT